MRCGGPGIIIQDCAASAVVTRRSKDAAVKGLKEGRRRLHFEDEIDPGTWCMVLRKPDMGPGKYVGPGMLVANNKKKAEKGYVLRRHVWQMLEMLTRTSPQSYS